MWLFIAACLTWKYYGFANAAILYCAFYEIESSLAILRHNQGLLAEHSRELVKLQQALNAEQDLKTVGAVIKALKEQAK